MSEPLLWMLFQAAHQYSKYPCYDWHKTGLTYPRPKLTQRLPLEPYDSIDLVSPRHILVAGFDRDARRSVKLLSWGDKVKDSKDSAVTLWRGQNGASQSDSATKPIGTLTSIMPVNVSTIILGFCKLSDDIRAYMTDNLS